jgi:hypothetical protein
LQVEALPGMTSQREVPAGRITIRRALLGVVMVGVFAAGVIFSFCALFSRFPLYDDEGKMLLFTRQLISGYALYDQVHFIYGPSYLFAQWLIFSALRVPLGNDTVRVVALLAWWLSAWMLAATAWRQARNAIWAVGLAAIVWVAAIFQLNVFTNEPGHPQQLIALLLASALWISTTVWDRSLTATVMLLGGIAATLVLTKINVGVSFALALGLALVSLGTRPSAAWTSLRVLGCLAILALPTVLMRSRFVDGFGPFCLMITGALLPCCVFALFGASPQTIGLKHVLLCGLGALAAGCVTVGFALTHGNTLAEMGWSLVIHPLRGFAGTKFGGPLALPRFTILWSLLGAGLGLSAFLAGVQPRRILWPLRLFVCLVIFTDALVARSWDSQSSWISLPLFWLLLVPPDGFELHAKDWFLRLLLALTACLQPIQIFPVPGSQVHIGTLLTILVGVVLLLDLCHELRITDRLPLPMPFVTRVALTLLVVLSLGLVFEWRTYERISQAYALPSLVSVWSLVGGGLALVVLWGGAWPRRVLRPLRLLACLLIFGCVVRYRWDTDWTRFVLPLLWVLLIAPARNEPNGMVFRLSLLLAASLRPLRVLPVDGGPFHLPTFAMLLVGAVLLCDFLKVDLVDQVRRRRWAVDWNLTLASLALVLASVPAFAAARTYENSVPLDVRGCRWIRLPERNACLFTFLAINVEASSDSVVARNGLMSLHFWADRPPVSDIVLGNEWDGLDTETDQRLLLAHRDHLQMMFIDNPAPWYLESHRLEFSKLAAALRAHTFFDFIGENFKQIARVANCRLLVRKERHDLDLYDCAYEVGIAPHHEGKSLLRLKLPHGLELRDVAKIELVDVDSGQLFGSLGASTSAQQLLLLDGAGHEILPKGSLIPATFDSEGRLFLAYPTKMRLNQAAFPAVRFIDSRGKRLLTLPVAVEVHLGAT